MCFRKVQQGYGSFETKTGHFVETLRSVNLRTELCKCLGTNGPGLKLDVKSPALLWSSRMSNVSIVRFHHQLISTISSTEYYIPSGKLDLLLDLLILRESNVRGSHYFSPSGYGCSQ